MIRDIKPKTPVARLRRDYSDDERGRTFDAGIVAAVVGFSRSFIGRALGYGAGGRPKTFTLEEVLLLLDLDGYQETFLPRSLVPGYLFELVIRL